MNNRLYRDLSYIVYFVTCSDGDALHTLLPKHDTVGELDEHMAHSPLPHAEVQSNLEASPNGSSQMNMQTLPPLTGPHKQELSATLQQQQQQEVPQPSELCVASYDEMDIENLINGEVTQDDEEEEDEDEDMETTETSEHATQEQQQQQQHVVSYENDEDQVYMAVQSVTDALTKSEQLNEAGSSLEPQQLQQLQNGNEYTQKLEVHTPTSTSTRFATTTSTTPNTPSQVTAFPMSGCTASGTPIAVEDEIGAFFKAIAMKIRNAQLEPVAFTDLQINILRVINDALRNL